MAENDDDEDDDDDENDDDDDVDDGLLQDMHRQTGSIPTYGCRCLNLSAYPLPGE